MIRERAIRNGLAFSEVEEVVTIVRTSCGDWISSSLSRSAEGESSQKFPPGQPERELAVVIWEREEGKKQPRLL